MALLNTGCLISVVQADITGITTGYAAECFVVLAAAVDSATQDRCVTVPTSGSLPSLWPTQSVPQGQVMFVDDVGVPVIAASGKWIGFDQRAFRYDHPVFCLATWGSNLMGVLADGTTTNRSSPGSVAGGGVTWCDISAGYYHSAAIKTDGTLWTWGCNTNGQLGTGNTTSRCSPGTVAGGGTTWKSVKIGNNNTFAIKTDGTLWSWGYNGSGQLGDGTITGRSSPGTVAGGGNTWCLIAGGVTAVGAIKTDGTLWTWGRNVYGGLGDGTTTNRSSPGTTAGGGNTWCQASGGGISFTAVKTDGTLWTWGNNSNGQLGNGTMTDRSSPGTVAGGGSTWCFVNTNSPFSGNFTVALKTDGTLWTWGVNGNGTLGNGTTTNRCSPGTTAGGGTTWCQVSNGGSFTLALKTDASLWAWGVNNYGQFGDGTTTNRSSPITVGGGGTTWCRVSAGTDHSLGIKTS